MHPGNPSDDDREVDLSSDDEPILATQTRDDTDMGWSERRADSNDDRLLEDRPPHW